jgi:hypothetical protein
MAKPPTRGRSRRFGILILSLGALFLVGAVGVVLALSGVHVPLLSSVFAKDGGKQDDGHAGKVGVLISPSKLTAFTAIDPAAFLDPKTGDFYASYISQKAAEAGAYFRDPNQIRGRVLNHDKEPGLAFSEADFFPRGTRASPTAAITAGHRGMTLSAQSVEGLRSLKRFDMVDIVAVISEQASDSVDPNTYVGPDIQKVNQKNKAWETTRRNVAQGVLIVVPVPEKNPRGGATSEEAFVSVTDEEFTAITEAMTRGAKLQCGARSGLPGGDNAPLPAQPEGAGTTKIRVTAGTSSSDTLVPASSGLTPTATESNGSVPVPK